MHPFLDIHTHRISPAANVQAIYNAEGESTGVPAHLWLSVGLHPWFLTEANMDSQLRRLEELVLQDTVKLIGECGFDRLRGPAIALQRTAFSQQVQLAMTHGKPLIIHCVRAFDELQAFGKHYAHHIPMIVHGFNKSPEQAKQLIQQGFYLSFGRAILNESSGAARTLKQLDVPFFLETDAGEVPIQAIYEQAAFLRNETAEALKDTIFANWKTIRLI